MKTGPEAPEAWNALIVTAWSPYGRGSSTLGSVYGVLVGDAGSDHDRFIARKLLEEADQALLVSAIRTTDTSYSMLALACDNVGASDTPNVLLIKRRALQDGISRERKMASST